MRQRQYEFAKERYQIRENIKNCLVLTRGDPCFLTGKKLSDLLVYHLPLGTVTCTYFSFTDYSLSYFKQMFCCHHKDSGKKIILNVKSRCPQGAKSS